MNRLCAAFLALGLAAAAQASPPESEPAPYAGRPEVRAFIRQMVKRHAFDARELQQLFARARREQAVLDAIQPTASEADQSWELYRGIFVNPKRIGAGLEFWARYGDVLARAQRVYGVPEEFIVAIIGVETFYGRHTGRWRVVDALATLAFDYPPRAEFFRQELANYLLYARKSGIDVFSVKGSYAGAIGIPQFMPGSYLKYAVDFDGDGVADLSNSAADAIGSVANFLKQHGWQSGEAVQYEARISGSGFRAFLDGGLQPRHRLAELAKAGVVPVGWSGQPRDDARAVLVELESPDAQSEYRLGLQNFYVITRYNNSLFYACAVSDLAAALRAAHDGRSP
ncbi:MAG TPA: lytic murein transglycosylase B [Burkholderiales bacterium]|nr:lytic murein transglycosylase B [Burkholderiales bacterium]